MNNLANTLFVLFAIAVAIGGCVKDPVSPSKQAVVDVLREHDTLVYEVRFYTTNQQGSVQHVALPVSRRVIDGDSVWWTGLPWAPGFRYRDDTIALYQSIDTVSGTAGSLQRYPLSPSAPHEQSHFNVKGPNGQLCKVSVTFTIRQESPSSAYGTAPVSVYRVAWIDGNGEGVLSYSGYYVFSPQTGLVEYLLVNQSTADTLEECRLIRHGRR